MKHRKWKPDIRSPWLTRSEAADYLRWSESTLDRHLVPIDKGPVEGKIRYSILTSGKAKRIRVLAEDVYTLQPLAA